jgi:threonine dehydrogenase-like Zn-dependent dehydrogenase
VCKKPLTAALPDGTIAMGAGLSDFLQLPAASAYPVGDAPVEHAAMGEPVACVAHSVRLSGVRSGDRVAIIGAGYMGRLHLALSRITGAGPIGLIDVSDERLGEAREAGAAWTATPDTAVEVGGKQDIVFVTAGAPGALELAMELVDDGGNIVIFGAFPKDLFVGVSPDAIHHHEFSIIGVLNQEPQDWRTAAGLIKSGVIAADLEALVSARYSLDDVSDALGFAANNPVFRVMVGTSL